MKLNVTFIFIGVTALLGVGCAQGATDDATPKDATPLTVNHCASCHGADGLGNAFGPQIANPVRAYATFVTRHGRNDMGFGTPMAAFGAGDLSDAALGDVLDFLDAVPRPTTGDGLYLRFCGNCHGADALGGRSEQSLLKEVDEADEFSEAVREGKGSDMALRTKYMPSWTTAGLSDTELEQIRAYVASLSVTSSSVSSSSSRGGDDDDDD